MRWTAELGARLLLATRAVDRGYQVFDRARSALVATLASERVLERFSQLSYGRTKAYHADEAAFRAYLWPFEEEIVAKFFPPPPARVLVGGAGGGREAFALTKMGYRVVAFEPSPPLAATLAKAAPENCEAFRAAYEDLPQLFAALPGGPTARLDELEPFAASIIGWGSFSHLMREEARVRTLSSFGAVTRGAILVTFLGVWSDPPPATTLQRLHHRLVRARGRSAADVYSASIGFYHRTNQLEVERQAAAAGLEVRYLNFDTRDTNWPHAVLARAGAPVLPRGG